MSSTDALMCRLMRVLGAATAKYAGQHVHERLVKDDAYLQGRYTEALKSAFINTDADMKNGVWNQKYEAS